MPICMSFETLPDYDVLLSQVDLCADHGKDMTLYCKECKTPICSACMTRKHKKHDVVDVDENRKEELLENLNSAIDSFSLKKEKLANTQIPMDRKKDECLEKLKEEKEKTLNLVRDRYDSMIEEATNQKEETRRKMMTSLDENMACLTNIKRQVKEETLRPRDVKSYQETLDSIKQHTELIPSEPRVDMFMEYTYLTDKERLVGELCGKLQPRNHRSQIDQVLPKFQRKFKLNLYFNLH